MQQVSEGLRLENEEQLALQQQLEQQQSQLTAADQQHAEALAQLAALRLTALDGTADKLLEQARPSCSKCACAHAVVLQCYATGMASGQCWLN